MYELYNNIKSEIIVMVNDNKILFLEDLNELNLNYFFPISSSHLVANLLVDEKGVDGLFFWRITKYMRTIKLRLVD